MALSRGSRLPRSAFVAVLKRGKGFNSPHISLRFSQSELSGEDDGESQFSFVFPSKYEKNAPARNRFKRRGREIIRKYLPRIKTGYHVAFFARKGASKLSFSDLQAELVTLLERAKLIV